MLSWYIEAFRRYADFDGRTPRRGYWAFVVVDRVIFFGLAIFEVGVLGYGTPVATYVYMLVAILPGLSVLVRRFHDTGRSGWFILVGLVPLLGPFYTLVIVLTGSQRGVNRYGPNPRDEALPTEGRTAVTRWDPVS